MQTVQMENIFFVYMYMGIHLNDVFCLCIFHVKVISKENLIFFSTIMLTYIFTYICELSGGVRCAENENRFYYVRFVFPLVVL